MAEDLCLCEHASVSAAAFCSASSKGGEEKLEEMKQHPKNHRRNNPYFTFNKSRDLF